MYAYQFHRTTIYRMVHIELIIPNEIIDDNCQTNDIIYKCIASTTVNPNKAYLRTAKGNLYYNQKKMFNFRKMQNAPPFRNMYGK